MKIVRNDKLIKRNKTIGNVASIAGIAILIFGLVMSFNADAVKTLISFIALIVGFVVSQLSTYFVTRFGRQPRYDEVIAENLSKLNDNYTFYVYSTPVPMVLVGPAAIWIPITLQAGGEIYYDKKWKQRGGQVNAQIVWSGKYRKADHGYRLKCGRDCQDPQKRDAGKSGSSDQRHSGLNESRD